MNNIQVQPAGNHGTAANPVIIKQAPPSLEESLIRLSVSVVTTVVLIYTQQKMMGASTTISFRPEKQDKENRLQFKDVIGAENAKQELEIIVNYLKDPSAYDAANAKLPRGILLYGPPGTGKTLLAKACAGEANAAFFAVSGSDFDEMYVGVGSGRMKKLFTAARSHKGPSIIFIDEIDSVGGKKRDGDGKFTHQTLNQLLAELDGFRTTSGVVIIAATNHLNRLEPALMRPGRFDVTVEVSLPDLKSRKKILEYNIAKKNKTNATKNTEIKNGLHVGETKTNSSSTVSEMDNVLSTLAQHTRGMSGADLEYIINAAALEQVHRKQPHIDRDLLEWAQENHVMGRERTSYQMSAHHEKIVAHHEAGHALVACLTPSANTVHKMTIVPRQKSLGHVMLLPTEDTLLPSRSELLAQLDVAMGGRIAEELLLGIQHITTGATGDLQAATRVARNMVTKYGMTAEASFVVYDTENGQNLSSETKASIEREVQTLLVDSYARAKTLLLKHRVEWEQLAIAVLKYKTLSGDAVRMIANGDALSEDEVTRMKLLKERKERRLKLLLNEKKVDVKVKVKRNLKFESLVLGSVLVGLGLLISKK